MPDSENVISYDYGRRHWLRPKWYMADSPIGGFMCGPYPAKVEVRPIPDPDRICVNCGADRTEGDGFRDRNGFLCVECANQLELPKRGRFLNLRIRIDNAYWHWCEKFGKRVRQHYDSQVPMFRISEQAR